MSKPLEAELWGALTPDELHVWRTFFRMRRALDRALDRQLSRRSALSGADCEVLRPLMEAQELSLRAGQLARVLEWDASRLSHHLRRMQSRDLISRRVSSRDGRVSVVSATPEGVRQFRGVWPSHVAWVKTTFFEALSPNEQAVLEALSARVLTRLHHDETVSGATDHGGSGGPGSSGYPSA